MRKSIRLRRTAAAVALMAVVALAALGLAACGGDETSAESGPPASDTTNTIVGAGASFPYPLYSKWGSEYAGLTDVKLNYQSIGSGGGISAITAKTVDFGASDDPLEPAELEDAGLVQWPQCVGGVVMIVNLEGIESNELRLTGELIAKIYNGDITDWGDPAIAAVNKGVKIPSGKISVVHRSDSSGTTWIFTSYLAAAAGDVWTLGGEKEIAWPTGVGGKGNEGVAASVQQLKGSIGYVEYAYAEEAGLATTQVQNADGEWVKPSLETFTQAAAQADWAGAEDFYVVLVNQPGATTWPITGASFILTQKEQADAGRAQTMLKFFDWAFTQGGAAAEELNYVPLPESVYTLIESEWEKSITAAGGPVWPL